MVVGWGVLEGVRFYRMTWRTPMRAGVSVKVQGIQSHHQPFTLVLWLQSGCRYCAEAAVSYRKAVDRGKGCVFPVAILPDRPEIAERDLRDFDLSVGQVISRPLSVDRIRGTPTVALIDSNSAVVASWTGFSSHREEWLIRQIEARCGRQG